MTKKEKLKLLQDWEKQFHVTDKAWKCLKLLFGNIDCDSAVGKAIWQTFTLYTDALSKSIGDTGAWLNWYCWENNMGADGKKAKAAKWKRLQPVNI